MDQDLCASIISKNKNNIWVPDDMVSNCYLCKQTFGLFYRKHHCRACGNIICSDCWCWATIPSFVDDRPNEEDYWNLKHYVTYLKSSQEKVCLRCFASNNEKVRIYEKITEIFKNPKALDNLQSISDSDIQVKNHYLHNLRNIQYYLPNHAYTEADKNLLKVNATYFSQHSKYLVQLIKSIDFTNDRKQAETSFIMSILNSEKNKQCIELYCTRTCHPQISIDDCINILYTNPGNLPDELLKYIFNIVSSSPDNIIISNIQFFVKIVINNNWNMCLTKLLEALLTRSIKLVYQTFWYLNVYLEKYPDKKAYVRQFMTIFDPQLLKQMASELQFYDGLVKNLADPVTYLKNEFGKCRPVSLPYNPSMKLINVDLGSIEVKDSKTNPVIITFTAIECINGEYDKNNQRTIKLLFKNESLITDIVVLNIMSICDVLFEELFSIDFGAIIYPIMPITMNSGMIEIVDSAVTLYELENRKQTIHQFIAENNEDKKVGELLDRYLYSLVTYTLYSYFIGIGDRHKHNIMISKDGAIFHIDFDYIMGNDAYPLYPSAIRIDSGMIDVIGKNSDRYRKYINLCSEGVIYIRKYFHLFFVMLNQCDKFNTKHLEKFVLARFQPRQTDDIIVEELLSMIKKSNDAYSEYFRDVIHYHTQENTVQVGLSKIYKLVYEATRYIS